jgi:hypothetical protein
MYWHVWKFKIVFLLVILRIKYNNYSSQQVKMPPSVYDRNVYGKNACIWEFASRRVAGFYNTSNTLTQTTLRKDNVIPIFCVNSTILFARLCHNILGSWNCYRWIFTRSLIIFKIYGMHAVINYFPNQQIHENFLTTVTICSMVCWTSQVKMPPSGVWQKCYWKKCMHLGICFKTSGRFLQ